MLMLCAREAALFGCLPLDGSKLRVTFCTRMARKFVSVRGQARYRVVRGEGAAAKLCLAKAEGEFVESRLES